MLVLSRKRGESVVIGEGAGRIIVTVVEVEKGRVKIGLEAPREVEIMREELTQGKAKEK